MSISHQSQTPSQQGNTGGDDILTFQSSNTLSISSTLTQSEVSNQQTVELKKGLKKIQQNWNEKNQNLEGLMELARKASKNIFNYLSAIESETEVFSKNLLKNSKSLMGQINWSSGRDFVKISNNFACALQELALKTQDMTQSNIMTVQKGLGDFTEQISQQKKQMNDKSTNTLKHINNLNDKLNKQFSYYVKSCKNVENLISEQKNSQQDIRLYYNVAYTTKQDLKIKDQAKEAEKEEQKVQQIVEEGNQSIDKLPTQIADNYKSVKDLFKQTLQRIIDSVIAIHEQQSTILTSFNMYVIDKNLLADIQFIDENDQKIIQERLLKKNPDIILPGVNFIPIQQALQRKEEVSENQKRAYPEAAFQYLEVYEQLLNERKDLMKNIKDYMNDLSDCYGNLYGSIETQSKEIKKALSSTKGDTIVDLIYAIVKEMVDQQQKQLEQTKSVFQLIKGSVKTIATCVTDQQSQSSGFFNMTKKQFNDFNKTSDKKKWVNETSQFLGISLDSFKQHEQKRLLLIKDQMVKIVKEITLLLETTIKSSKEQQAELVIRKEGLDEEINQVFITHDKIYENIVINSDGVVFDYQKQFSISSELQKQLDVINSKQYIQSQIDYIITGGSQAIDNILEPQSEESSPQKSRNGSGESQNSNSKDDNGNGKKEQTKFSILFGVGENEQPIDSFNCAFSHKILLQGKMYLFNDRIGFHSYFNSQSFVGDTALSIPYSDIQRIEKRKNALIFDNSIAIITNRGELFFTSFVMRDNCFKLITYLIQTVREGGRSSILPVKKQADSISVESNGDYRKSGEFSLNNNNLQSARQSSTSKASDTENRKTISDIIQETLQGSSGNSQNDRNSNSISSSTGIGADSLFEGISNSGTGEKGSQNPSRPDSPKSGQQSKQGTSPQLDPINQEDNTWIEERRKKQMESSMFQNIQKVSEFEILYPNVSAREVFNILFTDKPYKPQPESNQEFTNFRFYIMQEFQKDTDIVFEKITPSPPEWYSNLDCYDKSTVKSSQESSTLEYKVVHPVREKIPFGPKVSFCANKEKYFWISPEEFIMEREITLSKIPYCDYFTVRFQYIISQVAEQTKMIIKLYVNFIKSTTFKGRIENGTISENSEVINQIFTPHSQIAIQNYIKFEKPQRQQAAAQKQKQQQQQQQELKAQQSPILTQQQNNEWIEERRKRFKTQSIFSNAEKTHDFELIVPEVHPREIFNIIFYDTPFKEGDKNYPHFLHYFMQEFQKDTDMQYNKFSPPPPEWYANLDSFDQSSIKNFEDYSLHEYKYVHPVREKIPFGPKVSYCENKEKYFWISGDEFIMEKEVFLSKIPYCDYFTVRQQYQFTKNNPTGTKITCRIYVNFMKSTTFKGRIENGSISENTDVWKNSLAPQIVQVMSNYVKNNADKRKQRADSIQLQNQPIRPIALSYSGSRNGQEYSQAPPRKSKREIILDQQNQITQLYKLNEERFSKFNKNLNEMQNIIDHQNTQFKNILYVIIIILIINLIHLFR